MPPDTILPLELLHNGEWADVAQVAGESAWVHRLAEIGIRPGCRLEVLQAGCPCLIQVGGVRLSIRSDQGTQILVRPCGAGVCGAVA
jgi:ferrous iron transport protein A